MSDPYGCIDGLNEENINWIFRNIERKLTHHGLHCDATIGAIRNIESEIYDEVLG